MSGRVLTEANGGAGAQTANKGYYENSIAHRVEQKHQHLSSQHSAYRDHGSRVFSDNLPPPSQTLGSNAFFTNGMRVSGVNFEMWMSPNQSNMDKKLHDFTSLQSARDLPRCDPTPLEDVRNWRSSYPCLATTLDSKGNSPKFDIVMIETSYKVMSEFPPPKATLGLRLELNFSESSLGELFDWTCTTHIYNNGVPLQQPRHYRLEAKWGMVAPSFEPMWWASTFIDKIEQKKQAEETGNRDVYRASQERAHEFFSQLTAVHELRARFRPESGFQDSKPERRLIAVLLWKFSIAPESYVGTTSWQRLLPPPARITTNSPSPNSQEIAFPPLAMDTIVENLHDPLQLEDGKSILHDPPNPEYQDYHAGLDDSSVMLSHQDFQMTFKEEDIADFASMQSLFMPPAHGNLDEDSFHTLEHFDYDIQLHGLSTPSHHGLYPATSNNLFETHHGRQKDPPDPDRVHSQDQVYELHQGFDDDPNHTIERRPLANFNHNTHNMLQAQLGESGPDLGKHEDEDETLRAALAAASAINDLQHPLPAQSAANQEDLSSLWEDVPLPHRLQLHAQHSFATHASYNSHAEQEVGAGATAVNSNAFDANDVADVDLDGYDDYNQSTSSPEIRRLLEMHNQSFDSRNDSQQQDAPPSQAKQDFENGLDGSFVLVESHNGDLEGCE